MGNQANSSPSVKEILPPDPWAFEKCRKLAQKDRTWCLVENWTKCMRMPSDVDQLYCIRDHVINEIDPPVEQPVDSTVEAEVYFS